MDGQYYMTSFGTAFLLVIVFLSASAFAQLKLEDSEKIAIIESDTTEIKNITQQIFKQVSIDISIGSTYYNPNDDALVFSKVSENGLPIDNAFCDVIIFNPNSTEFDTFQMTRISGSRGIYSANFTAPSVEGVYIADVNCFKPINESSQQMFFSGKNGNNPPQDLELKNSTGFQTATITLGNVQTTGETVCHLDRFSTAFPSDFSSGEFEELGFVKNITNLSFIIRKSVGASEQPNLIFRFFKETDFGEVHLDTVTNQTTITTSDQKIFFPTLDINSNFKSNENLEIEICVSRTGGVGTADLIFSFNSTTENSGFTANSIKTNQTLDFIVGGASELNVRNDNLETAILVMQLETLSNHNICISNTTLQHNITLKLGNQPEEEVIQTEECPFGCDTENNRCNDSPFFTLLYWVVGGVVGVIFLIWLVIKIARI